MGGAAQHLFNFVPALPSEPRHHYVLLIRDSLRLRDYPNVTCVRLRASELSAEWQRLWFDLVTVNRLAKELACEVIVSLTNFGPIWSAVPHVLFQRNALYYSQPYIAGLPLVKKLNLWVRVRWLRESMERARLIVTPSNSMAAMIRNSCPSIKLNKFRTLHHGYDLNVRNGRGQSIRAAASAPVLFYPAHLGEYKGFRLLFSAMKALVEEIPEIVLILTIGQGDDTALLTEYKRLVCDLEIEENVRLVGRLTRDEVSEHLAACTLMVFPSKCESFGFPLLEAMGAGAPIVASDIPVNREIAGDAALFFDTDDPVDAARQIRRVIIAERLAAELRRDGELRLQSFDWSWRRYAREFAKLIDEAADEEK